MIHNLIPFNNPCFMFALAHIFSSHPPSLLLRILGHSGYRPRRDGERKRKSVRGCIVGPDMSALDLVIVKKGDAELPGITDKYVPRRLGPKRASKIRKLFVSYH